MAPLPAGHRGGGVCVCVGGGGAGVGGRGCLGDQCDHGMLCGYDALHDRISIKLNIILVVIGLLFSI